LKDVKLRPIFAAAAAAALLYEAARQRGFSFAKR
jgi:tRNA(Leu) C34 or U34 (ribose-2'-O)-methylase TrmL